MEVDARVAPRRGHDFGFELEIYKRLVVTDVKDVTPLAVAYECAIG